MVSVLCCFLSDENGRELDPYLPKSISCTELTTANARPKQWSVLPNGTTIDLQRVDILITGYVTIVLDNGLRHIEPFSVTKQILLCAPEGTQITCRLTDFHCSSQAVNANGMFQGLLIAIDLCLSVQSIHDIVVTMESQFCKPRKDILLSKCFLPDQQPSIPFKPNLEKTTQLFEKLCLKVPQVYDWVITPIIIPQINVPFSCVYEVMYVAGNCNGISIGDYICKTCTGICEETFICSNQSCTLLLSLTSSNCTFCPAGGRSLSPDFVCTPPAGRILNINQGMYYNDLQPAIDGANAGNSLIVFPGNFIETADITVNKPLTISGLSAQNTVIEFPNPPVAQSNLNIAANNVTINNLHFLSPTITNADDVSLLRIDHAPGNTLYDNITLNNLIIEGGPKRLAIINASNIAILNSTFIHTGNRHAIELRSGTGTMNISGNTFSGGPDSRNAIIFQVDTPTDTFINASFIILNNTVTRFSHFVLFNLAANDTVSIHVSNNVIDQQDRPGPTITFIPPTQPYNFSTIAPILIENNQITNPNPPIESPDPFSVSSNLSVYVDYTYTLGLPTSIPANGQIQVYNNIFNVALPWGLVVPPNIYDVVFPNDPVGYNMTDAPGTMSLNAFALMGNVSTPIP